MNEPAPAPSPAPTPTPTPATPANTWVDSIPDAELRGHAQLKGWDKLDPAAAFTEAAKAHRNAERMIGVPADQLLRMPKADDEAGWKAVWQKLGAPDKPEGYDLTGIDFDDPDMTSRFAQTVRDTAAALNMPKAMAERMAHAFHKYVSDAGQAQSAESTAALQAEQSKLAVDWGSPDDSRFKANMFIADSAAQKLGVTPEALTKLKDGLGASEVAKLFLKVGIAMGEDRYVSGNTQSQPGLMSRDGAVARRAELMADQQWVKTYLAGGQAEKREMLALNTLISGGT